MMICNNPGFRKKLQEITDRYKGKEIGNQIKEISDLPRKYSHSIKLEKAEKTGEPSISNYNCYMYTFDLLDPPMTKYIYQLPRNIFPNSEYTSYLIDKVLTKIDKAKAKDGDYVVYFHDKKPEHAGKFRMGKVVSKWGLAHLWEHGLCEVPIKYGKEVEFFRQISKNQSISAFRQWVDLKRKV